MDSTGRSGGPVYGAMSIAGKMGFGSSPRSRPTFRGFSKRSGIEVELEMPDDLERLDPEIELALFRAARESLTNVQKNASSDRARVVLGDAVKLEISDRGAGVAPEQLSRLTNGQAAGVGLAGMRERLRLLGGEFEIVSEREGTRIRARQPRLSR